MGAGSPEYADGTMDCLVILFCFPKEKRKIDIKYSLVVYLT